jgi:hypothetical protein
MAKRRKPKTSMQPLLITDDRDQPDQPDEVWILAEQLPDKNYYGWSESMLVCQFEAGDLRPTLIIASYDFERGQWRSNMGEVESVTHWQPLPDSPKEHKND